jgi:hypothetical protein
MTSHAFPAMLERLLLMYGAPETDDAEAYLGEYARQLRNYSVDELSRATDIIFRSRRFKTWPTIGECIEASEQAREQLREKHPPSPHSDNSMWSTAAQAWADEMARKGDGRIAAEDGWILGLHHYLRREFATGRKRPPSQAHIMAIQETARFVDRCAAGEIDMGGQHDGLQKLARNIVIKRQALAQRLFGLSASSRGHA